MSLNRQYFDSLIAYSKAIMEKSIEDSDQAVRSISAVIEILLNDSTRISKMSSDTIGAMKGLESIVAEAGSEVSSESIKNLISALSGLVKDHRSVNDILMPIVEALQFQDAIRQQMENLSKVLEAWLGARIELGESPSTDQMKEFGEKILRLTTMQIEREIIRRHIPGLPEETKADDITMF